MAPFERFRRSLALRLSLGFALLFTLGFSAIFALLYWRLGQELEARDTDSLRLRLQQYAEILRIDGATGLEQRLREDSQSPSVKSLFIQLTGPGGVQVIPAKVPADWIEKDIQSAVVPSALGSLNVQHTVYTFRVPRDDQQDLVIVQLELPNGQKLQVGRSTDNRAVLLAPLRHTFIWVGGAVVLVGFGVGLFAARRATRPLGSVVETARRIIARGDFGARVPVPKRDDEVAELVRHFNTVLDQNAGLVRAMREALDNVAHDLRTPLTSLRGSAELALQQAGGSSASREALAGCVEQADEVLRLLRALMEISEAEAGMLRLDKTACDLGDVARSAGGLYTEVAEAKRQRLGIETSGPVPVSVDATRLRQAVANLIDNALKYTPEGGTIDVRAAADQGRAVIEVRDTGPGVPPAEQARIWERLYRGDASRSQHGLGLGLSLVRAIVEAHGGTVGMRNVDRGGAVFTVTLPLATPA
jgi:signal transduction histidine kinase